MSIIRNHDSLVFVVHSDAGPGPTGTVSLTGMFDTKLQETFTQIKQLVDTPAKSSSVCRYMLWQHGARLWTDLIPGPVRDHLGALLDNPTALNLHTRADAVPWELLNTASHDPADGFLIERFPVLRTISHNGNRPIDIRLRSSLSVLPPDSPKNAADEIQSLADIWSRRELSQREPLDSMIAMIDHLTAHCPQLIHFACHNVHTDGKGSTIKMADGHMTPAILTTLAATRQLRNAQPLVFLNACRSAGSHLDYTELVGWWSKFVDAGAAAFIGSLWAVRSDSARLFADVFYDFFLTQGQPLGTSVMNARRAISQIDNDPTWLAYTVHGNASTKAIWEQP